MNLNAQITRVLVVSVPVCMLVAGSLALFRRRKTLSSFLQLFGAGCLVIVVLLHVCETVGLFPSMGWGLDRSVGHYLDVVSAVLGLVLFPVGYVLHAVEQSRDQPR